MPDTEPKKKPIALKEEETLKFWQKNEIFQKTLGKPSPKGEFVFYEGPPTANGKPGIHHLEARAFKDAIPRYKTMQGFRVRRKGGWDTHGLPVELQVEKELGLKSKKEIESYGIGAFNDKCKQSVWKHVDLWRKFTERMGYWVDLDSPYVTYQANYIESLWAIMKKVDEQGLLYKDYKVVPWCPRCGTGLSSHELAQGYQDVKDLSVTVKFKVKKNQKGGSEDMYILAWTTTPWTLPGNVGLAVGKDIEYVKVLISPTRGPLSDGDQDIVILAKDRLSTLSLPKDYEYQIIETVKGSGLVGLEYEPLYPFLSDSISGKEKEKLSNAFKVYSADFVTTTDGTGIVHTAVMYGTDDFELGTKVGLPKYHLVNEDGTFKKEAGFLAGRFVKDEAVAVDIIKDLANRPTGSLLFSKEKYAHSYPHCWRCKTPLIYYARDSWYIKMSSLRDELVAQNKDVNWEPAYIKDGRFGEWLKEVKDWAISRERYWGTPLPLWQCESCKKHEVIGSFETIRERTKNTLTKLILVRHSESEKNTLNLFSSDPEKYPLTEKGRALAVEAKKMLVGEKIDAVYVSPVLRARQTAEIVLDGLHSNVTIDERLTEVKSGSWDEKRFDDPEVLKEQEIYKSLSHEGFYEAPRGGTGESWKQVEERAVLLLKDILARHNGGTVMLISHEGPLAFLLRYLEDAEVRDMKGIFKKRLLNGYALPKNVFVDNLTGKEFNPHRPGIDTVVFPCECGGEMKRVKEVMDVWFDSGAMPFAQDHYPFENVARVDGVGYPADFISEAIDQTRGWFYTLHAIGVLMGKGKAYKNVICLGHILDSEGKKMSKSLGNVVDPWLMMEKHGADALRLWMYSVNQPGESKNFDEKTVDEIVKKFFNLLSNVLVFYEQYKNDVEHLEVDSRESPHALDQWILALQDSLVTEVTKKLEKYQLFEPVRAIREFIADLSQWYLRRSRERFKGEDVEDKKYALATTRHVLITLSKLLAPFAPFFAESLYQALRREGKAESVHLAEWPKVESRIKNQELGIMDEMNEVRRIVSLGLEQRAKANVKVRQPLSTLKIKSKVLNSQSRVVELIEDEVNVKEILFDENLQGDVELDIAITPELKEEGDVRELVRAIQDFRKEMKLSSSDMISLSVEADEKSKAFFEKHKSKLTKATLVQEFVFELVSEGHSILSGEISFKVKVKN